MSLIVRSLSPLLILICASVVVGQWKDPFEANRDSLKGLSPLILKVDYGFMNDLPDDPTEREVADLVKQRLAAFGINVTIHSDETREELSGMRADIGNGEFTARDRKYLQSLEARLTRQN